jgi:hypothetical protein
MSGLPCNSFYHCAAAVRLLNVYALWVAVVYT